MKMLNLLLGICLTTASAFAQGSNDAAVLLNRVYQKLEKARDYSVDGHITVNMPFIRIQPMDARIYFKQKDKLKVVTKGITVVPRQGFAQITKLLGENRLYTPMIQGVETVGQVRATLVTIIPVSDTTDLIFGKFWIDPEQAVILRSQLTTRSNGTILTEYTYGTAVGYGLPDRMVFTVDVKKFRMPKNVTGNGMNKNAAGKDEGKEGRKGTITVVLTGYRVNVGLDDALFRK